MINQDLIDRTMVGKVARRFDFKFSAYYIFLTLLNLAALALAIYDAKGLLILLITIGFSYLISAEGPSARLRDPRPAGGPFPPRS
ncbi:hypothetical protein [Deinococcus marmoris]|uniref:hypothetical protein n=1 Tax=Deinococcus marmoris TaxID=249408 RepID=UPI00158B084F|nr:hypothetical protein [Deinococcus marmoris]